MRTLPGFESEGMRKFTQQTAISTGHWIVPHYGFKLRLLVDFAKGKIRPTIHPPYGHTIHPPYGHVVNHF